MMEIGGNGYQDLGARELAQGPEQLENHNQENPPVRERTSVCAKFCSYSVSVVRFAGTWLVPIIPMYHLLRPIPAYVVRPVCALCFHIGRQFDPVMRLEYEFDLIEKEYQEKLTRIGHDPEGIEKATAEGEFLEKKREFKRKVEGQACKIMNRRLVKLMQRLGIEMEVREKADRLQHELAAAGDDLDFEKGIQQELKCKIENLGAELKNAKKQLEDVLQEDSKNKSNYSQTFDKMRSEIAELSGKLECAELAISQSKSRHEEAREKIKKIAEQKNQEETLRAVAESRISFAEDELRRSQESNQAQTIQLEKRKQELAQLNEQVMGLRTLLISEENKTKEAQLKADREIKLIEGELEQERLRSSMAKESYGRTLAVHKGNVEEKVNRLQEMEIQQIDLKQRLLSSESSNTELQTLLAEKEEEIKQCRETIQRVESEKTFSSKHLRDIESNYGESLSEKKKLEARLADAERLQRELQGLLDDKTSEMTSVSRLSGQNSELQRNLGELKEQLKDVKEKLEAQAVQLSETKKQMELTSKERDDIKLELGKQVKIAREDHTKTGTEKGRLNAEITRLKEAEKSAQQELLLEKQATQTLKENLQKEISKLKEAKLGQEKKNEGAMRELETSNKVKVGRLEERLKQLQASGQEQSEESQAKQKRLEADYTRLQTESQKKLQEQMGQNTRQSQLLQASEKAVAEKDKDLADMKALHNAEITKLRAQLAKEAAAKQGMEESLRKSQAESRKLKAEVERQSRVIKQTAETVQSMLEAFTGNFNKLKLAGMIFKLITGQSTEFQTQRQHVKENLELAQTVLTQKEA